MTDAKGARVGIVIIGRNEGERLRRCLQSVRAGDAPCVYVDSGSSDGSFQLAAQMGAEAIALDLSEPFTAGRARNTGFNALMASHPQLAYVQFIDGDCELVAGWIDTACAFLEARTDVAIVCGRCRERHPERSIYNHICDIEWDTPIGESWMCGGNFLARVSAFASAGGFRHRLIAGEEPELCLRLRQKNWRIWRLQHEMVLHDAAIYAFRQWWRRATRGGHAMAEVTSLHRDMDFPWHRNVRSALTWTGLLGGSVLGSVLEPRMLWSMLLFPAQVIRIARRQRHGAKPDYRYATLILTGKLAESWGILTYAARRLLRRPGTIIEYK